MKQCNQNIHKQKLLRVSAVFTRSGPRLIALGSNLYYNFFAVSLNLC